MGYLLFDYYGEDSLKLRSLAYNSPPAFIFDALFDTLEFMADERRKSELHELDKEIKHIQLQKEKIMLIGEREKTIREVGYNKALVENPNVHPVAKAYIRDNTQLYQDKINQLNDSLGIEVQKIDILV